MSEEQEQEGTWSSLKKTVVGVLGTVATAGGVWLTTLLGGGDKEAAKPAEPAKPVKKKEGDEFKEEAPKW